MFFKNLQIYRLPAPWAYSPEQLAAALASQSFVPCTSSDLVRQGWVSPREDGRLVHTVNKQMLIRLATERKLLPASVVNQVVKDKAAEMEEAQGFAPGKKAMKELKERVADELLPRAFSIRSDTWTWIDPVNGYLVVDAASPAKADDVVKLLLKAVDKLPLESLRVQRSPVAVMTAWLEMDEAPSGFTIDQDATLRACGNSKAQVGYKCHTLEPEDLRRHIAAGKQCTKLAMTWNDRISFVLTETLAIKSIKPLDVIKENDASTRNDAERFDNDMMLMTGELAKMLADIVAALGGEAADLVSPAGPVVPATGDDPVRAQRPVASLDDRVAGQLAARGLTVVEHGDLPFNEDGSDPLYDKAVQVVMLNQRASISLVQRHLVIGYNRAAHLLEEMETKGVLGPMMSNGVRAILVQPGTTA